MIITKKSVSFAFILLLVAAWPCTVMAETSSGLTFEQARSLALQHNPAVQHAEASVDRKRGSTEATRAMGRLHADVISSYTALSETP